jgi:hypothetical protein
MNRERLDIIASIETIGAAIVEASRRIEAEETQASAKSVPQ